MNAVLPSTDEKIEQIREAVVGMYSKHPWPSTREADEEMGWRLRMLGIGKADYAGKRVLDVGCGTGEYALWYGVNGAREVVGIDLADGSLAVAERKRRESGVGNVTFLKKDALQHDLPDNSFDYVYAVGVLHHTGDPEAGFRQMCRVVRPGGVVVVSLYNRYSRSILRFKQSLCKLLGGDDLEKRARIGRRLFPVTMHQLNKRYHETNYEAISYDIFGFPHESVHTAGEILKWFDANGIEYIGSFAPLRLRDYFYAYSLPEYHEFKKTFSGFPLVRLISAAMNRISTVLYGDRPPERTGGFPRPSALSMVAAQTIWFVIGTRINCFTMAGRKRP
ncbi:MAG TPA: methyltransferase domain-containing protein [Thermoanaerobaculia bacterium]